MFYLTMHSTHLLTVIGRKVMFYLTTHSTHFIYGYRKEGNVLFNTFHLWLYGVRYMVQNHSDSERGYTFFINSKGSFI